MRTRARTFGVALVALTVGGGVTAAGVASSAPGTGSRAPAAVRPAADSVAGLRTDLDAILATPGLKGAGVSVTVRRPDGTVLYSKDPERRLEPASNAKLFTSTAALDTLGPSYRFTTSVLTSGQRSGSTLRGDIAIRGGGDPTMLASDYDALAAGIAAKGITTVAGGLLADDSFFDHTRLGEGWAWDDEPYYYSGQTSALTVAPNTDYDAGSVIVDTTSGAAAGDSAKLNLVPATGYVTLVNKATTVAGSHSTIDVERQHGTNTIVVTGTLGLDYGTDREWATVWEPTGYAADVFRRALAAHGVTVTGATTLGPVPARATVAGVHRSAPLSSIYIPFLKLSNNMHAEALVKTMGAVKAHDGSWPGGLAVETPVLRALGVDTDDIALVDGSGLSRMDYLSSTQVTNVLLGATVRPWFTTWYGALPIAAQPDRMVGGTLRNRMKGTAAAGNVHAKTGSLTGVSSLSGYVTDADGQRLVFSVLENSYVDLDPIAVQDKIAVRLATYSAKATAATAGHGVPALPHTATLPADIECSWAKAC